MKDPEKTVREFDAQLDELVELLPEERIRMITKGFVVMRMSDWSDDGSEDSAEKHFFDTVAAVESFLKGVCSVYVAESRFTPNEGAKVLKAWADIAGGVVLAELGLDTDNVQ